MVNIMADNLAEGKEFFEVVLAGVEVEDALGVKKLLTDVDQERIILGQKQTRIFIIDDGENN